MDLQELTPGISVVICCYNSSSRLLPTLRALATQRFDRSVPWEIILVDNASTDSTAVIALDIWENLSGKPLINFRILSEKNPGQAYARKKGIRRAVYQYVLFCDDDNWLSQNYVQGVYEILTADESIGACGGQGIPVFETEKPEWFGDYAEAFAVGSQNITMERGRILNLYGAGMAVNRKALERLNRLGFQPLMAGRSGNALSSSDDTELTYALVLSGFRLHYAAELSFSHYLPAGRLQKRYLKNLFGAFGKDGPVRNLYYGQITQRFFHRFIRYWFCHLLLSLYRLMKYWIFPPKKRGRFIFLSWNLSYIRELLAIRKNYPDIIRNIATIPTAT